jgi:hypothetical protein
MPLCQEIVCVGEVEQFDGGSEIFKKQQAVEKLSERLGLRIAYKMSS